jgi:hypothetical protein
MEVKVHNRTEVRQERHAGPAITRFRARLKVKARVKENTLRHAEVKREKSRESERGNPAQRHARNAVAGVKITAKAEERKRMRR